MFQTTRAIVLHNVKYSDTSLVVTMYTEQAGRRSFMVQGVFRKKSKFPPILFQPLTLLEIELSYSPKRELQHLKEANVLVPFTQIPFQPFKGSIAIFLSEILYKTLREEESNPALFDFLEKSVHWLDISQSGTANFHLWFLLNLTRFLGFYPEDNFNTTQHIFDPLNGKFYAPQLANPNTEEKQFAEYLHTFLNTSPGNLSELELNHVQRNKILENLINYYHIHLGNLGVIKSQQVLQEIFRDI